MLIAEGAEYPGVDGSDTGRGLLDLCGCGIAGLDGFWVWVLDRGILDVRGGGGGGGFCGRLGSGS